MRSRVRLLSWYCNSGKDEARFITVSGPRQAVAKGQKHRDLHAAGAVFALRRLPGQHASVQLIPHRADGAAAHDSPIEL